jgi:transcriptional regulator with XRE-family HTH domain
MGNDTMKLKAVIKAAGLRQKDVADRLNVTEGTVSRWVSEKRTPRISDAKALADLLNMTLEEFTEYVYGF